MRRAALQVLSGAFNAAVKSELIASNPCAHVERPRRTRDEVRPLDEAQAQALLTAARGHGLFALYAPALGAGMRMGEILALQWPDVDLERGAVTVRHTLARVKKKLALRKPKTKAARRKILLPPFVAEALTELRTRREAAGHLDKAVFCTRSGALMHRERPGDRVLPKLLAKAGLPKVRFHDLRHTHASILLSRGYSLRAVAARLGHSNPELTLRVYAHVLPNDDNTLAAGIEGVFGGNGSN